ncbi:uncharacterized protein LOC129582195 [Paramacrobiotus metropolitanus]|uniref:uncharacterized protein LOC129582195 n=1 Tax=Paramacrobiotus metropolitanus TaxID=2943436 RepID=UPI00244589E7|nr:uncharacterized protein LOC129582195 [Paramacrobiotus metropolitanus]
MSGTMDLPDEAKILMEIRELINALGPYNISFVTTCMIRSRCFDTAERLTATVALIVDKALAEPHLAEPCAKLCAHFLDVETGASSGEPLPFRRVLLRQSQTSWESAHQDWSDLEAKVRQDGQSESLRASLENAHRRCLTHIRFLSQLHVNGSLMDCVIISLLQKLLPAEDSLQDVREKEIECVCLVLQTCGPYMQQQEDLNVFFEKLQKIMDAKETLSRIRVMMEETVGAKKTYVPHKTTTAKPPTRKEVRAAKKKEEQEIKQADAATAMPFRQQLSTGIAMGRGGLTKPSSVPHAQFAMSAAQPSRHGGRLTGQPLMDGGKQKTLRLLADSSHGHTTMLGPRGGPGTQRPLWGAGSGMDMRGSASTARLPENKSASSSRESSVNRMNPRGSLTHTPTFPEDTSVERSATPLASGTATPSQVAGTPSRGSPVQEDLELDADAVTEKAAVMLTQATNLEGEESREMILDCAKILRRWTGPTKASFIRSVIEKSFEVKPRDREKYVEFFSGLAREGLFSQEVLTEGMGQIVEATDDIAVDVPEMYAYTAGLIGPLLADNLLTLVALDGVLSKSPARVPKYHGAFRKWLDARLSPEQKEEMINRDPVIGQKILGSS